MTLRNTDAVCADLVKGLPQLEQYGFRLVREVDARASADTMQLNALHAACALLGLPLTFENLQELPVVRLAYCMVSNALNTMPASVLFSDMAS